MLMTCPLNVTLTAKIVIDFVANSQFGSREYILI